MKPNIYGKFLLSVHRQTGKQNTVNNDIPQPKTTGILPVVQKENQNRFSMKKFQPRTKICSSELPLWKITDATIFIPVVIGGEITIGEKYQ
jgi:hypothetical protein